MAATSAEGRRPRQDEAFPGSGSGTGGAPMTTTGATTSTARATPTAQQHTDSPVWLASSAGMLALACAMFLPWPVTMGVAGVAIAVALVVLATALGRQGPGVGHGIAGLVTSGMGLVVATAVAFLPQFDAALVALPSSDGGEVAPPAPTSSASPPPSSSSSPSSSPPSGAKDVTFLPPATVSASVAAPDSSDAAGNPVTFGATNAVDGDPTTAWRVPGDGVGASLVLTFDRPVHVAWIGVIPGYAKTDPADGSDRFTQNRRVRTAQFQFSEGQVLAFTFADRPQLQQATIDVDTRQVTMQITSSTPAERDFTAVSEVEVYGWLLG